jgi:hypothetical protein
MGSDDIVLVRQAAYSLFAARALQESGYKIDGFQVPLVDPKGGGITIPFGMLNAKGLRAAVYTQSEPWTEALLRDAAEWIVTFRAIGVPADVPVIVASQWLPPAPDAIAGAMQILHLPQEHLPGTSAGSEAPAPPASADGKDEGTPAEAVRMAAQFVDFARAKGLANLDYTSKSLADVDRALDAVKAGGASKDEASGLIYAAGCYVGEVFVREAGGIWRPVAELGGMAKVCSWPIAIELPDASAANPIGKAFKRFENGSGDSLAFFWFAIANRKKISSS